MKERRYDLQEGRYFNIAGNPSTHQESMTLHKHLKEVGEKSLGVKGTAKSLVLRWEHARSKKSPGTKVECELAF